MEHSQHKRHTETTLSSVSTTGQHSSTTTTQQHNASQMYSLLRIFQSHSVKLYTHNVSKTTVCYNLSKCATDCNSTIKIFACYGKTNWGKYKNA